MPPKDKQDDSAPTTAADAAAEEQAAKANAGTPEVTPLAGAAAAPAAATKVPKPFLSEGMRSDLETRGWAVDTVSGARFDMNMQTGEVTVTARADLDPVTGLPKKTESGEPIAGEPVDVKVEIPATFVDPATGHTTVTDPETGEVTVTDEHGDVISSPATATTPPGTVLG
jgi:hypothetical protein